MPNQAAGSQQLLVQLESQQTGQVADGIPQLDGNGKTSEEETNVDEVSFTFVSDYADEMLGNHCKKL